MNYVWEVAILADKLQIPREKITYLAVDNGSPYTEVVQECLNETGLKSAVVEVNPLYRFSSIFEKICHPDIQGMETAREILFRCFLQYSVQLDLRQGMDRQEYAISFLLREFLGGVHGEEARGAIACIERGKLRHFLRLILKLYRCGSSLSLFREVMRLLYPHSFVYAGQEEAGKLLIYIGTKKTDEEEKKMTFLQSMFLPLSTQVFLFWEYHFGIIDVEETMELDNMVLF